MSNFYLDKDPDLIYDEYIIKTKDGNLTLVEEEDEEEYREDRMEQMISRHGY
jgi:hypothetical protein